MKIWLQILSLLLCYSSGVYCQHSQCWPFWITKKRQITQELQHYLNGLERQEEISNLSNLDSNHRTPQVFVSCIALLISFLSLTWLLANSAFKTAKIRQSYNRFEMPTAVACSLFAGICAVTEFHHSIDYSFLHWSDKWTFAAIDATALFILHAIIAFVLQ